LLILTVFAHNALSFHPSSYSKISVHYYSTDNPDPTKPFDRYTNASTTQVGAVLAQDGFLVMSYLRELTAHQQTYPAPALTKTLLSVFLTLQEFHSTLLIASVNSRRLPPSPQGSSESSSTGEGECSVVYQHYFSSIMFALDWLRAFILFILSFLYFNNHLLLDTAEGEVSFWTGQKLGSCT
jgi:hypothetical protein